MKDFSQEEIAKINSWKQEQINKINQKVSNLDKELQDSARRELTSQLENTQFIKLDNSKSIIISKCVHQWEQDSDNHKVCTRCGYGKNI